MDERRWDRIADLAEARRQLIESLPEQPSGAEFCRRLTAIVDEAVIEIAGPNPPFTVLATGGYGRRELAPFSDVDLTVLPAAEPSEDLDRSVREFFRDLYRTFGQAFGIEVGYAYRLISDAPGIDHKTRTGLLDMRRVTGPRDQELALAKGLRETFSPGEFILSKIAERASDISKFGDTPLVVEPHLKSGSGGLRCYQTGNWIREALGEQPLLAPPEYEFVLKVRNLLHRQSGKANDLLNRPKQAEIADLLEQDMYQFMSEVCANLLGLADTYRMAKDRVGEARFPLTPSVWSLSGELRVDGIVDAGEAAVAVATATQLGISIPDLRLPTADRVKGPAAAFAISTGEATIRNLDRCGLLAAMMPELDACRTLIPTDTVHTFTVFEHSLRVVRNIEELSSRSFLGEVRDAVNDVEPLYLAALLHDVGKQESDRRHSEAGAEIAEKLVQRWGLEGSLGETVVWLIREHLTMARFIRIRDIQNPDTIREFAEIVGSVNRLNLLTVLTYADIAAVADGAWTPAQETFQRILYERALDVIRGDGETQVDSSQTRRRLLRQLSAQADDESAVRDFVDSLPAHYLTSTPLETIRLHRHYAIGAASGEPTVEISPRPELSASDVTICALDSKGLLSRILGVVYAYDLSVQGIRACTTSSSPPIAVDVLTLSFNSRPLPPATSAELESIIRKVLAGELSAADVLSNKGKDPARTQEIFTYTYNEGNPGILEVRAPRGRGMPYRFSRLISEQDWNVVAARVGQWAGNAAAAFYIQNSDGSPIRREAVDEILKPRIDV